MTTIQLNGHSYPIPTAWNELSRNQLLQVMDCFFLRQYTEEQQDLKLLKILTGLNYWKFFRCKPTEMAEYFYLTGFLKQEQTGLTKQLLPHICGRRDVLFGPASDFDNMLMGEMAIADNCFTQWSENREDIALLDKFCGMIYRPAKKNYDHARNPDGDPREPFNQHLGEWRANNIIAYWPLTVKLAIVYWYDACRQQLVDENEEVFSASGEDSSKYGMVSMMLSVAETHALGDFSRVENHFVKTVLMQMNESIRKAKAQEKANTSLA